jgi:hypothetical protein
MAKKKTNRGYTDRKYNYPKGYTEKGKSKTGFAPTQLGARLFVEANLERIKKGTLPFDSLTTREKRIFRGKTSNTFANQFTYGDKRFYDPTGTLRKILDNIPNLKDKRNLTNLLPQKDFENLFNQNFNPTKYADNSNSSFYDFTAGGKKKFYRDESGSLLDIVTRLKKTRQSGREIRVIDLDGKILTGAQAIEQIRQFEADQVQKALSQAKPGEKVQLQIVYLSTDYNPFTNTVTYNLNNVQINNLANTP